MRMFTKTREAVKAETDIVCYKKVCMEETPEDPNAVCLRSICYCFSYTPSEMYTCHAFTPVLQGGARGSDTDSTHTQIFLKRSAHTDANRPTRWPC